MTIDKHKITASEIAEVNVKSNTGTRLTGTVQQNKHTFDKLPEKIIEHLNALIDNLFNLGVDKTVVSDSIKHLRTNRYQQLEGSADGENYTVLGAAHEIQDKNGNIMPAKPVLRFSGMSLENTDDATIVFGNTEHPVTKMLYENNKLVVIGGYYDLPAAFFASMQNNCSGEIRSVDFSDKVGVEIANASSLLSSKVEKGKTYLFTRTDDEKVTFLDPSLLMHVIPIENGGTGATTVKDARNALNLGYTDGAVPIGCGGTGATNVDAARENLGAISITKLMTYDKHAESFPAQTTPLDMSEYDLIEIHYVEEKYGFNRSVRVPSLKAYGMSVDVNLTAQNITTLSERKATLFSTSIKFYDCNSHYINPIDDGSGTGIHEMVSSGTYSSNGKCIPIAVYGIRGVV